MLRPHLLLPLVLLCLAPALAVPLPPANEQVQPVLPDTADVWRFEGSSRSKVLWWPHVINAAWGGGRGGPERNGGWLDQNWPLVDYLDRSGDYTSNDWLANRGLWAEVYGSNEYQETIHFHLDGAKKLLWDNGIARDYNNERVLSPEYNNSQQWWKDSIGWDAYIVCNNAPRWSAIINYDLISAASLGNATSQDNIGGPTSRIGAGSHGRYCDYCNLRFFDYLKRHNKLPEFRAKYTHIRDYVRDTQAGVLQQLPPLGKWTFDPPQAEVIAKLCAPPVLSEYQKFLYLSHLQNWMDYYQNMKRVPFMGSQFDVHGNQGGSAIGAIAYQVALMDFVDTVWFESGGISTYDNFRYHWNNADGAFRYVIGRAMTRGRKPFMSMTAFHKRTPDLVEHEMAEACAGGGVLFVNQQGFEKEPSLLDKMTDYYRFRHEHRALYQPQSSQPLSEVALVYSIPTMMYRNYMYSVSPPLCAMAGIARACHEGHVPYDVVIFNHPEIQRDHWQLDALKRYKVLVLPALECLSDPQIATLTAYLQQGGTLAVTGACGTRNEDNLPRAQPPLAEWRKAGRVVDLRPDQAYLPPRVVESEATALQARETLRDLRVALQGRDTIAGDLPRLLWVTPWQHQDCVSVHFVNYDLSWETGQATPTKPVDVTVTLPAGLTAQAAAWMVPGQPDQPLAVKARGDQATVTIPAVRVYGVLVIGKQGLDRRASDVLQAQAMQARAKLAAGMGVAGHRDDFAKLAETQKASATATPEQAAEYRTAATALLQEVQQYRQDAYLKGLQFPLDTYQTVKCFDFGATQAQNPWLAVKPDTAYDPALGHGWLPNADDSDPMPEELHYAQAQKYGAKFVGPEPAVQRLPFWPYKESIPAPLQFSLSSGTPRTFRADLPPGSYMVRVVTCNPSWTNLNFRVSGMVRCNGQYGLLDAPMEKSALLSREFRADAPDGHLDMTFGGPTGWGVAAVTVRPFVREEPGEKPMALREWLVSPRYSNPDWWRNVLTPLDGRLAALPTGQWTRVQAPAQGLPLIDLGSNRQAETGDVAYAVATFNSDKTGTHSKLHFGASSQAELWLNGKPLGIVPNEKGVREDEFRAYVNLIKGQNTLVVKLQRFWERHWMFYAQLGN